MNPENATSASSSATTSGSAPGRSEPGDAPPPDKPPQELSESEFLAQQAASAKAAIAGALSEMGRDFARTADPRLWAKQHPWATLAASAIAGFAAAATVVPSKEQQALAKLTAIERALDGRHATKPPHEGEQASDGNGKESKGGIVGMLIRELIGAVRPALFSMISAGLAGHSPPPPGDPNAQDQAMGGGTSSGASNI
jgi:hypothetical protein